jgi:negative regulator of genetic competence, sporulation and motility
MQRTLSQPQQHDKNVRKIFLRFARIHELVDFSRHLILERHVKGVFFCIKLAGYNFDGTLRQL